MQLLFSIALKHLLARKRQSVVSLLGIILGVAFFLTISSLMQGSESDFIRRLVDNSPHITINDEFRTPRQQAAEIAYAHPAALEIRSVKPLSENRGVRQHERILARLALLPEVKASPSLTGQGLVNYAGKDFGLTLNGMIPDEIRRVTTIEKYLQEGSIDALTANPDGIIVGTELMRRLSLKMHDNIAVISTAGQKRTFKIVGSFRVGRSEFDLRQGFINLRRAQALLNRPNRVNSILIKLDEPVKARELAERLEREVFYKCVSWQEASEDLMNTLSIRSRIMYTVVSAVLVVAAFGIYNVISTVVMEKRRDIAILKSMGFYSRDISRIFFIQGAILGLVGTSLGLPLGCAMMYGLMQIEFSPPGASVPISMPLDWGWKQFAIASAFAVFSAVFAALLPARKAAQVEPVAILRGSQ